jgi:uncharacterized protein (TIGR01619 family)
MTDQWNFYLCKVNGSLASIFLNMGLREEAPLLAKPWLLWVWFYFRSPREDGLSSSDEAPVLHQIENALASALSGTCGALLGGRITTESRREFYFYGETFEGFEITVKTCLASFPEYRFDLQSEQDPEWKQYLDVLYPTPRQSQCMANREVLEALERHGDVHTIVREVDHTLDFPSEIARSQFCSQLLEKGYRLTEETESGGELGFRATVSRDHSVDQDTIDGIVLNLMQLVEQFGGTYDGWGTTTMTELDVVHQAPI